LDEPPIHVYPVNSGHLVDGETCWCQPIVERWPRVLVIHRSREQILDG
jgi:hypothetical protein